MSSDPQRRLDPLTRVDDAWREIGDTQVSRTVAVTVCVIFLLMIGVPSLLQMALSASLFAPGPGATTTEPSPTLVTRVLALNRSLLSRADQLSDDIGERSVVVDLIRPRMQALMTGWFRAGTESVYTGQDGWLFFGADVGYVVGRPFLDPAVLRRRSTSGTTLQGAPQPDPRVAILDLHRTLRARGIDLVVMPTPTKPSVHPERLGGRPSSRPRNLSFATFRDDLEAEGVLVFDVMDEIAEAASTSDRPWYLATDTHWRPETMILAADRLAAFIDDRLSVPLVQEVPYRATSVDVTNQGDTARLLDLPASSPLFPSETVRIRRISPVNGTRWQPDPTAEVLLLGDSFTNIYSLEAMGWGASAGLAEQLSYELGHSVDRISQNDDGAHSSRELLGVEMARGRDRLSGKRVVVYQFSERELAYGDWRVVDMERRTAPDLSAFAAPVRGQQVRVQGVVESIGSIPRPGSVPYKDHIVAMHLSNLAPVDDASLVGGTEAVVYLWAMQDDELTVVSQYQIGDTITLNLEDWADVSDVLDGINRGELSDSRVQLAAPWWGEPAEDTP